MLRVGVFGATGRIGQLLIECLNSDKDAVLSSIYVREKFDGYLKDVTITNDICTFLKSSDVIIDFSSNEAIFNLLSVAIKHVSKPIVIGTTGLDSNVINLIKDASNKMPILYSSNMSRGVFVLNKLASTAATCLPDSDIEIVEIHHRNKKDAPSGTALKLAETCANARGELLDSVIVSKRHGITGERKSGNIGVMALRGGDIVGRHTVGFYLDGEYIELIHNATSRMTFAKGAVIACKWLYGKDIGLYSIEDIMERS